MMTEAPYVEFKFPLDQVLSKPSPRLLTSHLPQGHLNHYIEDKKVKVIQVRYVVAGKRRPPHYKSHD